MGNLKRAVLDFLPSVTIRTYKRDRPSMRMIKWSGRFLLFCEILYVAMTIYAWWATKKPDLPEFRQFLVVVIGSLAAITAFSRWMNDTDKDGVSDEAKNKQGGPPQPTGCVPARPMSNLSNGAEKGP